MNEDVTLGNEKGIVALYLQLAHSLIALMGENLHHHSFLHVFLPSGHHGYTHSVAIHGIHGVALRHEDGLAAVVGLERVLAIGLADKGALLYLSLQIQPIGVV